jgi:hypothetical protein
MAKKNMDKQAQPDQNNETEFPGYPHYPKTEDIMDGRSDAERVTVDVENLPNFHNATTPHRLNPATENDRENNVPAADATGNENDLGIEMGTEADVTPEEKKVLEDDMYYPTPDEDSLRKARLDDTDFDGEPLNEESFGTGVESGTDPEEDEDDAASDAMGQGDEENQDFSLGGEDNDNIVEGTP